MSIRAALGVSRSVMVNAVSSARTLHLMSSSKKNEPNLLEIKAAPSTDLIPSRTTEKSESGKGDFFDILDHYGILKRLTLGTLLTH